LVAAAKFLVAATKFLVAATTYLSVVPNFVAVTKPVFPCDLQICADDPSGAHKALHLNRTMQIGWSESCQLDVKPKHIAIAI